MHLYDSHAHLSSEQVMPQINEVMSRAKEVGVTKVLNICTCPKTLKNGLALQKQFPEILNAGATTPHDVEKEGEKVFPVFEEAAKSKQIVAIGETGLEYYYKELDRNVQKRFLVRYLHLAAECKLPVIFHCREAFEDLFEIVDIEYPKNSPAVLHCFTGNIKEAEKVLERGWYLSLSGIVTFKKSEELREVAKIVPSKQLLIETDTPYLAPQKHRGKQNEPAFIKDTAECIAEARSIPIEDLMKCTSENAKQLFSED